MKGKLPEKARLEHILDALKTIDLFIIGVQSLPFVITCA